MANGGTTGDDLERLERQVAATRADLAGVAGAVTGLTDLVTDLVRRSGSDHQSDRWQARLGSLETRLEMLETSIKGEVERMRAATGAVDALAEDFRSTVGGTRSLVDLAGDVGERLLELQALSRQVRGAAQDVASSVEARLDQDATDRERREGAIVARVDEALAERVGAVVTKLDALADTAREQTAARERLDGIERAVTQTQQVLDTLGSRVERVAEATGDLPAIEARLTDNVREAAAWRDAITPVADQLAALDGRLDATTDTYATLSGAVTAIGADITRLRRELDASSESNRKAVDETLAALASEIRELGGQLASQLDLLRESDGIDSRLAELGDTLAQVRAQQPQLVNRLDQLAADVTALQDGLAQPNPALEGLGDRLDALASATREAVGAQPDVRPQLDELLTAIDAVRTAQPDVRPDLAQLAAAIDELRTAPPPPDVRPQLDELLTAIDAVRTAQPDVRPQLVQFASALTNLADRLPDSASQLERVSFLLDEQAAALIELRAAQPFNVERLDRIGNEIAALREAQPSPLDVEPVIARIDAVSTQLAREFAALSHARDEDRAEPIDLEPLAIRLDAISDHLAELRNTQPASDVLARVHTVLNDQTIALSQLQATQPQLSVRLDQLATDLMELAERPSESPAMLERLDAVASTLNERLGPPPDVRPVLDQVANALESLRVEIASTRTDPWPGRLSAQLEELSATVAAIPTEQTDFTPQLEQLVAEVRQAQPDLAPHFDHLADQLRLLSPDPATYLDRITGALEALRSDVVSLRADEWAARLSTQLDELAGTVAAIPTETTDLTPQLEQLITVIRDAQPDLAPHFEQLVSRLANAVQQTQPELAPRFDELAEQLRTLTPPDVRPVLDQVASALESMRAEITSSRTDEWAARLSLQLDALTGAVAAIPVEAPDLAPRLEQLIQEVRDAQPDLGAHFERLMEQLRLLSPDLTIRLDQVQAELADLRSRLPESDALAAPVLERIDEISRAVAAVPDAGPALVALRDELVDMRTQQAAADPVAALDAIVGDRMDRVTAEIVALRNEPREQPAIDLSALLEPLDARFAAVDSRASATAERLSALEGTLSRASVQLEDISTALEALRETPEAQASVLMPVVDRLAIVIDSVSGLHGDVANLADSLSTLRGDRAQLIEMAMETNGRLDVLAANVSEMRQTAPDIVQSVQTGLEAIHTRIDGVTALVSRDDEQTLDLGSVVQPLAERLDAIAAQAMTTEQRVTAVLESLADAFGRVEAERATLITSEIDSVRQAVDALAGAQSETARDVAQRVELLLASSTAPDDAALQASQVSDQVTSLASDVKSAIRAVVGLGADVTGLRSELRLVAEALPDGNDDTITAALARLDTASAEREQILRDTVAQLDEGLASRDHGVREVLTDLRDALRNIVELANARPDDSVATAIAENVEGALREVHGDMRATRSGLEALARALDDLRAHVNDTDRNEGSNALAVAAASAMVRLEARIDGEFDGVGKQMEALGTLLGQAIDALHRVEVQIVGAQPTSERTRAAAASVLDALRANVRQRAARRAGTGAPPELGAGAGS